MPECNCTISKEYIYNEFTLKTEKLTKLINNDFVVKLTYDLLDNDKNILSNKELIVSSLFESIGKDLYNVITSATHHYIYKHTKNTVINSKTVVTKEEIENISPHDLVALKVTPTVTTSDLVETKSLPSFNNTLDGNHTFSLKLLKKNNTKNIQSKSNVPDAAVASSQPPGSNVPGYGEYFLAWNGGGDVTFNAVPNIPQLTFYYRFFENTGTGTIIDGEVVGNGGNLYLRDNINRTSIANYSIHPF